MKKILSLFLALIIVISNFSLIFAAPLEKELYNQSGKILEKIGILVGNEKHDLMLDRNLKRQDMAILISRLYQEEDIAKNYTIKDSFEDVTNSFYKPFISWSVDKNLIVGIGEGKFGFNSPVTVQQFQTLLLRVLGYGEEVKDYKNVPEVAKSLGMMNGLSVKPDDNVKRGLMAAMTLNALSLNIRGSSLTLAQKLNLELPDKFEVSAVPTIDKNNVKFEGVAKGTNELKIHLKPLSEEITYEEKYIDITLGEDGKFSLLIEKLPSGKYEYRFLSGDLSTKTLSITIQEIPLEIKDLRGNDLK